jgi:TRAP-type mannitol/chloroaromatic compound transport system permease small subunit
MPVGFALLFLQGIAEIIKQIGTLTGQVPFALDHNDTMQEPT